MPCPMVADRRNHGTITGNSGLEPSSAKRYPCWSGSAGPGRESGRRRTRAIQGDRFPASEQGHHRPRRQAGVSCMRRHADRPRRMVVCHPSRTPTAKAQAAAIRLRPSRKSTVGRHTIGDPTYSRLTRTLRWQGQRGFAILLAVAANDTVMPTRSPDEGLDRATVDMPARFEQTALNHDGLLQAHDSPSHTWTPSLTALLGSGGARCHSCLTQAQVAPKGNSSGRRGQGRRCS